MSFTETKEEGLPSNSVDPLVADALKQDKPLTEQQMLLKTYQEALNEFIKKVGEYPGAKSQLQRVLINLAISPLNSEELHHGYPHEKELFDLATSVNSAKFYLMILGMQEQSLLTLTPKINITDNKLEALEEENEYTKDEEKTL